MSLLADGANITVVDHGDSCAAELKGLVPPVPDSVLNEPYRWVYYPWRQGVARLPGPEAFRRLRLDRNRNKLTLDQQQTALEMSIGVVGASVGHAVAYTLALEGLAGALRLADFDALELSNLNRVPASVLDLGTNKSVTAARRIAELDPYLPVEVFAEGLTRDNLDDFLDGLDVVIEECDAFDVKVIVRERCRELGIPVIMETSDGGTLDVERFDLEPDRQLFHGLVGDIRASDVESLDRHAATAVAAAILEPNRLTPPMAASALELGRTVSAWPQLGGDVLLGGATVAAAIRRLVQGRPLRSGRTRFDRDNWLDTLNDPIESRRSPNDAHDGPDLNPRKMSALELITAAIDRAPWAGVRQTWSDGTRDRSVTLSIDPEQNSRLDVARRASAVALGAAFADARIAAESRGILGDSYIRGDGSGPTAVISIRDGVASSDDSAVPSSWNRRTDRTPGTGNALSPADLTELQRNATTSRTRLIILNAPDQISAFAGVVAESDRVRFLTPELHPEVFAEIAGTSNAPTEAQLKNLGLPAALIPMVSLLERHDVMALLRDWDTGSVLGGIGMMRAASASAILVLVQQGREIRDYVAAGAVMEELWLAAEALGLSVHPMAPATLYTQTEAEVTGLSDRFAAELTSQHAQLQRLAPLEADEAFTAVLRVCGR